MEQEVNHRNAETRDGQGQWSNQRKSPPAGRRHPLAALLLLSVPALLPGASLAQQAGPWGTGVLLPALPEARSPFVLGAVTDPATGKSAFSYHGAEVPPVMRTSPGSTLHLVYENHLTTHSHELCVDGPCRNMTNLHFHGLHVSPDAPQDDVISMMAMPGQDLKYSVVIPPNQAPGLYWYHTHPHGESYQQSLDGMSGAIVIDGIDRYVPEVRSMKEQILILRDAVLDAPGVDSHRIRQQVEISRARCGSEMEAPERAFTVNGVVRPRIAIAPGERQFWRIVNASPDLYADLSLDTEKLRVVAIDGMPLAYHDPRRHEESLTHFLLSPAGRLELIVTGPAAGSHASLRTSCVDTGSDGDPNPAMVLADLDTRSAKPSPGRLTPTTHGVAVHQVLTAATVAHVEAAPAKFTVVFTEDKAGFYINNKKYSPTSGPMLTVKTGHYEHWQVLNASNEMHPFHIHQVHFLVYGVNGEKPATEEWMDTVNIKPGQTADLVMDFTDPIIRGMSLFHCHLLKHEDKGMMAKILFQ
jgi:FtsP/CotA-like multicopper oxidase with cupredoxin domain